MKYRFKGRYGILLLSLFFLQWPLMGNENYQTILEVEVLSLETISTKVIRIARQIWSDCIDLTQDHDKGNDEHIVAAIKSNIISSALVIAHNATDTDLATYNEHKIICRSVDRKPNSKQLEKSDYDGVLESAFLHEMVDSFNKLLIEAKESVLDKKSYILDIDLDYFNTFNSIAPKDSRYFKMLVQNAGLLTVATEPEYVRSCARDVGLNSEGLLIGLQEILRQTGS